MPTILQITDTHLSPRNRLFVEKIARIRKQLDSPPDLLMATGDLSLDGADSEDDLIFSLNALRMIPAPMLALPGNHDTGSHPRFMPDQPFDDVRLDRWRRLAGPGRGAVDLPGWRVIGLNTEVMGTGHAEEAAQAAFIRDSTRDLGERRIALFLHKPVSLTVPEDPEFNMWTVPPAGRAALMPVLLHARTRLVASGHLHRHHEERRDGIAWVWAPPLSFVSDPSEQGGMPGRQHCGALLHILHEDHVETRLIPVETTPFHEVRDRTYPPRS